MTRSSTRQIVKREDSSFKWSNWKSQHVTSYRNFISLENYGNSLSGSRLLVKIIWLYAFFLVIPRRLNLMCRRFGTICRILISGVTRKHNLDDDCWGFYTVKGLTQNCLSQSEGMVASRGPERWGQIHANQLFLHKNWHHHPANKQLVLASLFHIDKALCDQDFLTQELGFLTIVFKYNG